LLLVGKVAPKRPKENLTTLTNLTMRAQMTTENKNTLLPSNVNPTNQITHQVNHPIAHPIAHIEQLSAKLVSRLEERKGNAIRPISLRPGRSVKKYTGIKSVGLKNR
jgi:hypothetical protein